ncbi:MAG: type II toxin-antitoxin system VapC family toxin [Terracidiphilus sp.]
MILLDTNVFSELMSPEPDPRVMVWIDSQDQGELWTCTIVVAEVLSGLDLMPDGRRQFRLRETAEHMFFSLFAGRIFDVDLVAARAYGRVLKIRKSMGRPIDEMDGLIGATALVHGATLATRNISDFEHCGIPLVNPWQAT